MSSMVSPKWKEETVKDNEVDQYTVLGEDSHNVLRGKNR